MNRMSCVLGISLDYLMLKKDRVRGDVCKRQLDYASHLEMLSLVVYSPKTLKIVSQQWSDNLRIDPTNSVNKAAFIVDAYRIASKICEKRKIDIITTEDPFITGIIGYLLKRKFKKPLNTQSHVDFCNNKYWLKTRKINRLFNVLGKFILKRADSIRVGTYYEKDKLVKMLKISQDKINVIPVNSEIERFIHVDGKETRNKILNRCFDKILLFTGRLVEQKGLPDLLKAFKLIVEKKPTTVLLIIGRGPKEEFLREMVKELKISNNVVFSGSIDHKEIPEYVAACDVYTISSLFEGTCIAMAEAMAAGKPVVATRFAGAMDLINDGETGFVVNQKDYKDFADKVLFLLGNPKKSQEMGMKAAAFVRERFENNKNIDAVISLWEKTAAVVQ